jgi:hypothetical protein
MTTPNYASADPKVLEEIIREAESLLAGQLTAATAADQRALTFAGLLVASVAAFLSFSGTAKLATQPSLLVSGTLLAAAAIIAFWSAAPGSWDYTGNMPSEWKHDIDGRRALGSSMAEMAEHYDAAIARNYRRMRRAAIAIRTSMAAAGLAMIVAILTLWARYLAA